MFFWGHCIKAIVYEKDKGFYAFSYTMLNIFQKFHIAEKTEKNLRIFNLEIFKYDFQIPGKILSEILVRHDMVV